MATSRKVKFIEKVIHDSSLIILSNNSLLDSIDVFLDRGYSSGGADPITATDLEPYEMTYDQFTDIKTFVDNFKIFLDGGVPAVNKIRDDK